MTLEKKASNIIYRWRVSWLWIVAAVVFWVLAALAVVLVLFMAAGFNNYQSYLDQGRYNCAEYCDQGENTLYLHDLDTQACQCYNDAEKPTDYKNLRSGVEIKYEERDCLKVIEEEYSLNECVFEGCSSGDAIIMKSIGG